LFEKSSHVQGGVVTSLPDPKPITVGVDVSKATLDVAIGVKATPLSVSNKTDGFDTLLEELARHRVALIMLEATGGLEMAVACVLQAAGYVRGSDQSTAGARLWSCNGETCED
jgi:hypothetical protein